MKKVGPFSVDLVVGCKIYEMNLNKNQVTFSKLVKAFEGKISKATVAQCLKTLDYWGVIKTEFHELESGRAGRTYVISGESESIVASTYNLFWEKMLKALH